MHKRDNNKLKKFYFPDILEAGCDEAGRGCLAGPVFAAAVILPQNFHHPLLNDSKKVHFEDRYILREYIEKHSLAYAIGQCSVEEIDKYNILKASIFAMHKAINNLSIIPEHILVDGNYFLPYEDIPHKCIIKGDSSYMSIAAASILAKTYRDDYMMNLDKEYPQFKWHKNKGYATLEHRIAIQKNGLTIHHRKSFCSSFIQMTINFE